MSDEFFSEVNTVMNYFALVEQCECPASNRYSLNFSMKAMPKIEKLIKEELHHSETQDLFSELEEIFFPNRMTTEV